MRNPIPVVEAVISKDENYERELKKFLHAVVDQLESINNQLRLLNERIEETFETGITSEDMSHD